MRKAYTTLGDDGYTSLLGPARVPKYHPQPEAYGTVDEASAAIGLARALTRSEHSRQTLLQIQRHLCKMMSELACTPETIGRYPAITCDDVTWLEQQTDALSQQVELPRDFVASGDSLPGAALDVARTVTRRAERQVVRLIHDQAVANAQIGRYLNRLSSFLFVLARYEDALAASDQVAPARLGV